MILDAVAEIFLHTCNLFNKHNIITPLRITLFHNRTIDRPYFNALQFVPLFSGPPFQTNPTLTHLSSVWARAGGWTDTSNLLKVACSGSDERLGVVREVKWCFVVSAKYAAYCQPVQSNASSHIIATTKSRQKYTLTRLGFVCRLQSDWDIFHVVSTHIGTSAGTHLRVAADVS